MAYELKDGQGSLFRNDKGDNERRPDYRGELNIDGVVYELSSWIKEGQRGKWMSISAKPKEQRQERPMPSKQAPTYEDDEIPFIDPYKGRRSYVV